MIKNFLKNFTRVTRIPSRSAIYKINRPTAHILTQNYQKRFFSLKKKIFFEFEDDEEAVENIEKMKNIRGQIIQNIHTHDTQEFQKIVTMYSNFNLVNYDLFKAFETYLAENQEEIPEFTQLIIIEKILSLPFRITKPYFFEKFFLNQIEKKNNLDQDRVILCLDSLISQVKFDEPSLLSSKFFQEFVEKIKKIENSLNVTSRIKILKIGLHCTKSITSIPENWFRIMNEISSIGDLIESEPIILALYDMGEIGQLPDELRQKLAKLSESKTNSLRVQKMLLNLMDKEFMQDTSLKNQLEDQLVKIFDQLISEHEETFFSSLVYYLNFSLDFFTKRSMNYRRLEPNLNKVLGMLMTYYDNASDVFNLEETTQILNLYHKTLTCLKYQVPEYDNLLMKCLTQGVKLTKLEKVSSKIKLFRVINKFVESQLLLGVFDSEISEDFMTSLVSSLTSSRVNFSEFLEICKQITLFWKHGQDKGISKMDAERLFVLFSRQCLNLKFENYEEVVKILTVLDYMIDDIPEVEGTKHQLLSKFRK